MRIQTTLSRRAKITRAAIAIVSLVVVVTLLIVIMKITNAAGGCQATYIDHTSKGGTTQAACAE